MAVFGRADASHYLLLAFKVSGDFDLLLLNCDLVHGASTLPLALTYQARCAQFTASEVHDPCRSNGCSRRKSKVVERWCFET